MINQAAEDGPATIPWWRDWRGECAAIIACGPSVRKADLKALERRINVIAIKSSVDAYPNADVVYGCDSAWWRHRQGLQKFKGLKLTYDGAADNLHKISIDRNQDGILVKTPGRIGSGGNSGFQALNIAVQFGATGILLIGFDMYSDGNSPHWFGRNDWQGSSNPVEDNYQRWRASFVAAAPTLKELGVDVVNASMKSTVSGYRKVEIAEALSGWGL